jgi:catechol 2,3-dioxygenase-like lactoylglutathione lyase family enzyme
MTPPEIAGISPFFIVRDMARALSFYRDRLGFEVIFTGVGDDLFFGIVRRGGAMMMFKDVGVDPLPNSMREPAARWDAYLDVPDDGLRGFELKDSDGYVLFFGRPRTPGAA